MDSCGPSNWPVCCAVVRRQHPTDNAEGTTSNGASAQDGSSKFARLWEGRLRSKGSARVVRSLPSELPTLTVNPCGMKVRRLSGVGRALAPERWLRSGRSEQFFSERYGHMNSSRTRRRRRTRTSCVGQQGLRRKCRLSSIVHEAASDYSGNLSELARKTHKKACPRLLKMLSCCFPKT